MASRQNLVNEQSSINREKFLSALNLAKAALGKPTFVPVLSHFCLTGDAILAFDDTVAISVAFDTQVICAVQGDKLLTLVGSLSSSTLALDKKEGALHLLSGRSKLKLPYLEADAFVFKGDFGRKVTSIEINEDFLEGMRKCLIAVGADQTHPGQMGVTLQADTLFSTDNVTMSRYKLKGAEYDGAPMLLHTAFCQNLLTLGKAFDGEPAVLNIHSTCVVAEFGDKAYLYAKLPVVERMPDFERVVESMIPKKTPFEDIPPSWEAVFVRAAAVVNAKEPVSRITCGGSAIVVETSSPVGEADDTIEVEAERLELDFFVDPSHVLRATKECKEVQFAQRALIMRDGRFTHLITHCAPPKKN